MSTQDTVGERPRTRDGAADMSRIAGPARHRRTTETKAAFKTTEFMAFIAFLAAVFIAGAILDESNAGGVGGKQVWLYATIVTSAYLISRGLAKSGSRDPYWEDDGSGGHR